MVKKMFAHALAEAHIYTPRHGVDWPLALCWAGIAIALSILLTVLAVR